MRDALPMKKMAAFSRCIRARHIKEDFLQQTGIETAQRLFPIQPDDVCYFTASATHQINTEFFLSPFTAYYRYPLPIPNTPTTHAANIIYDYGFICQHFYKSISPGRED